MDRREAYVFKHFRDIADAKSAIVRNERAEVLRSIARALSMASQHAVLRLSRRKCAAGRTEV